MRTLVERALARARKQADQELEDADASVKRAWQLRELRAVEASLRHLSADQEDLTPYGRQQLHEARAYRTHMRAQLQAVRAPHEQRATTISAALSRAQKALRRAETLEPPRERMLAMLSVLDLLGDSLYLSDAAARDSLRAATEALPTETGPIETEPAVEAPAVEAPPPAPWAFEDVPPDLLSAQPAADLAGYRLNRTAQELSLVRGFDVLLTPQIAHGLVQYPHQIETARTVLRRMRGRALLCDEVGLGKTIEAGIIASEYVARGLVRRILVLTPPALVSQWREEMQGKFGLEFVTHDDTAFRQLGPEAWSRFDRILASVSTARLPIHREALAAQEFDLIVVDEAHHLRSRRSQSWKLVNDLKKRYVLLLTATPVQNDLDELFDLITLLSPGQLKTSASFRREFVARGDPRMPRNRERLRQLLGEVMVRNTRSQVRIAMPPRIAATHRVVLSAGEAELYAALTRHVREHLDGNSLDRMTAATLLREAGSSAPALAKSLETLAERRTAGRGDLRDMAAAARSLDRHAKADALRALLLKRTEKTVVFTFFRETLHLLGRAFDEAGISFASLSGEMSAADKDRAQAAFADDRRVLLSSDVGSEGRNLQFCHAIVNYDLPWNPMRIEQRVGRVHRIGQRNEVLIDSFCARRTIEDHILRILDEKLNMFEMVIGEVGSILGSMETDEDFEDLALDIWAGARSEEDVDRGFEELGERLREARARQRSAQELDEALFGNELGAETAETDAHA